MFTNIGSLIPKMIKRHAIEKPVEAAQVTVRWKKAVESVLPSVISGTKALFVKDGILYVTATNNAVAQEIQLNKHTILSELNGLVGDERVKDIRFRVG